MEQTQVFEKLGAFYLGKQYELTAGAARDELLLYDAKDLTTHAVCVGMTGSGKTGLCLTLLEEAAIDGVPAIAIDPKGDVGNLLLSFPELRPEDFRPWIDESAATRAGVTPDAFAAQTANTWRDGLAKWGQTPARIARFRDAVDMAIYTPGSNAGLPLTVLRSFSAPPAAVVEDTEAFRDRVLASTSGLLALLGIDADPVRSREHILISNLLDRAWKSGRNLDIASLIREVQDPPFATVGVVDLDTFFPAKDRTQLAMTLNNLLASPSFAGWMEGEPLDVQRLLYTPAGKPRLSIISIAHLSEAQRMFFVTILLNEVLAWTRAQPGSSALRALLYMDEVFGYFPPVANPPSKKPMLTLLKQARAYGLGLVLATQNPVDLDYKGLSNTGSWFLGRLQTERDKARVLEGLEGASAQASAKFDKQRIESILAGLRSRVFLMNNVHEDEPIVFESRWALSYLRGPLTRTQIQTLMAPRKQTERPEHGAAPAPSDGDLFSDLAPADTDDDQASKTVPRPSLPSGVEEFFLPLAASAPSQTRPVYRPAVLGQVRLHFARATYKVDAWQERSLLAPVVEGGVDDLWESAARAGDVARDLQTAPAATCDFAPLPPELQKAKTYETLAKELKDHAYRTQTAKVWKCAALKRYSQADETAGDFRVRLARRPGRSATWRSSSCETDSRRSWRRSKAAFARLKKPWRASSRNFATLPHRPWCRSAPRCWARCSAANSPAARTSTKPPAPSGKRAARPVRRTTSSAPKPS